MNEEGKPKSRWKVSDAIVAAIITVVGTLLVALISNIPVINASLNAFFGSFIAPTPSLSPTPTPTAIPVKPTQTDEPITTRYPPIAATDTPCWGCNLLATPIPTRPNKINNSQPLVEMITDPNYSTFPYPILYNPPKTWPINDKYLNANIIFPVGQYTYEYNGQQKNLKLECASICEAIKGIYYQQCPEGAKNVIKITNHGQEILKQEYITGDDPIAKEIDISEVEVLTFFIQKANVPGLYNLYCNIDTTTK